MLEKTRLNQQFSKWPLHLTLIPWFTLHEIDLPKFLQFIESTANSFGVITLITKDISFLGKNKDVRVIEVKQTEAILALHQKLLKGITEIANLSNGSFVGSNFRPHITLRDDSNIQKGKRITCRQLFVVAQGVKNTRQIVHQLKLG